MTPNQQWLQLRTPDGSHMFWLSNDGYDNETGFAAEVEAATALLEFPEDWYARYEAGETWGRAIHEDPHPNVWVGATVHEEGWYAPES